MTKRRDDIDQEAISRILGSEMVPTGGDALGAYMRGKGKRLKVYHDHDGTWNYMVAVPNIKEAARLLKTTVGSIRRCGGRYTESYEPAKLALETPGEVWKLDMRLLHRSWTKVTR